jgi:hypothetical protein
MDRLTEFIERSNLPSFPFGPDANRRSTTRPRSRSGQAQQSQQPRTLRNRASVAGFRSSVLLRRRLSARMERRRRPDGRARPEQPDRAVQDRQRGRVAGDGRSGPLGGDPRRRRSVAGTFAGDPAVANPRSRGFCRPARFSRRSGSARPCAPAPGTRSVCASSSSPPHVRASARSISYALSRGVSARGLSGSAAGEPSTDASSVGRATRVRVPAAPTPSRSCSQSVGARNLVAELNVRRTTRRTIAGQPEIILGRKSISVVVVR